MNTMLVRLSLSGMERIWLTIWAAVRLPWNPCRPVMQKEQFILQPACEETQSVALSRSGIYTLSTSRPGAPRNRYFTVPSVLAIRERGSSRPTV